MSKIELNISKENLMKLRVKISKSNILTDLDIQINVLDIRDGLLITEIDTLSFKVEPKQRQWKILKSLISKQKQD